MVDARGAVLDRGGELSGLVLDVLLEFVAVVVQVVGLFHLTSELHELWLVLAFLGLTWTVDAANLLSLRLFDD